MSAPLVHSSQENQKYYELPTTNREAHGFTLVELLVVITILAILSTIGLTVFGNVQKSARDAKRREDLKSIANALEIYKAQNGLYPQLSIPINWVYSDSASDPWIPGLNGTYMVSLPKDPVNLGSGAPFTPANLGYKYAYYTNNDYGGTNGSWFLLVALLESPSTNDKKTKCTAPNGTDSWGGGDSTATNKYGNAYWVCNQQ